MNTLDVDYTAIAKRLRARLDALKAACAQTRSAYKRHDYYRQIFLLQQDVDRLSDMVPMEPTEDEALSWLAWGVRRAERTAWWGNKYKWHMEDVPVHIGQ